jgi:alpha-glucosidase (family GH31 glycosyl hydrolase)
VTCDPNYMPRSYCFDIVWNNKDGLRYFANFTNNLIREWFKNEEERILLKNVNCISIDFIDEKIIEHII